MFELFINMPTIVWKTFTALGWWWLAIMVICWVCYIVFQVARHHYDTTTGWQHIVWSVVGIVALAIGFPTDVIINVFVAWLVFADPPKEVTLTKRLRRYLNSCSGNTWFGISRGGIAEFICTRMLDPWQDGGHCRRGIQ